MSESGPNSSEEEPRAWILWSAVLVLLYLGVAILGWDRTLIPDEIIGLVMAERPLAELLEFARNDLVQTPLSYFLARAWLGIFGGTDTAAKLLPLTLGSVSLFLFTYLATRVTPHWRAASLLFWASYLRIGSAPNLVRMYAPAVVFVIVAAVMWDRWRLDPKVRYLGIWCGFMILLFYTHGSGLLLLPAFVVSTWLYGPRDRRLQMVFHGAAALALLALAPWFAYVTPVMIDKGVESNIEWVSDRPTSELADLPFYFFSGEEPGGYSPIPPLHQSRVTPVLKWVARVVHLGLLLLAWPLLRRLWPTRPCRSDDASWTGICLLFCAIPVLALYGFSVLISPALHPRYLVLELPFYFLLLVLLGFAGGRPGRIILLGLILPWMLINSGLTLVQHQRSSPIGDAVETVVRDMRYGDLVLADRHVPRGFQVEWEWTHRHGRSDSIQVLRSDLPAWLLQHFPGVAPEDLDLSTTNRIWYIHDGRPGEQENEKQFIASGFVATRNLEGDRYAMTLYERRDASVKNRGSSRQQTIRQ
jgi:hypothetical protein